MPTHISTKLKLSPTEVKLQANKNWLGILTVTLAMVVKQADS